MTRGAEARRKKGPADTEVWRRELAQVGIEYGSSAALLVPIYNTAQMARCADTLDLLVRQMRSTLAMHRLTERTRILRCVWLITRARGNLRRSVRS